MIIPIEMTPVGIFTDDSIVQLPKALSPNVKNVGISGGRMDDDNNNG